MSGPALVLEARFGLHTIDSGETRLGAQRFAAGAGRHGTPLGDARSRLGR